MKVNNDNSKIYIDELAHFIDMLGRVGTLQRTLIVRNESIQDSIFRSICCSYVAHAHSELTTLRRLRSGE